MSSTDLTNTRTFSPKGYRYTYDNPTDVGPRQPMQLEFWIPKGRKGGAWVPATRTLAEMAEDGEYHAWRKVRPHHSHADKLAHSIGTVKSGYARTVEDQIKLFLAAARARGLTRVHSFAGCKVAPKWAPTSGLELTPVDPADFIGDAPQPEVCE